MMEIPRDMNGFEKSITSSRTKVMVSGATAISAFCKEKKGIGFLWCSNAIDFQACALICRLHLCKRGASKGADHVKSEDNRMGK